MGLLTDALQAVLGERKTAVGATIPTWEAGVPQYARDSYTQLSRAYSQNEIVYAAIEELASSAAEPEIAAYRKAKPDDLQLDEHPVLDLFDRPNPFSDKYQLIAGVIMFLHLAGNVFLEKVRSRAGTVVELWLLRPDRVRVLPDDARFIGGYEYRIGDRVFTLAPADVIHIRTRNPRVEMGADYYGLPPLAVCLPRVEADVAMRAFTGAFFRNAGVPAGLLNIKRAVNATDRELMRNRFRQETGGANAHSLMVIDDSDVSYTPMGLPLGARGVAYPELDEISEARIAMPFGVPLELIGARLGMIHGNRSTMREARAGFWDETLSPLYEMLANALTHGLVDDFTGWDYLGFDTSTVKALAEDVNELHTRVQATMLAGIYTLEEARQELGKDPEIPDDATLVLGRGLTVVPPGTVPPGPPPAKEGVPGSTPVSPAAGQPLDQADQSASVAKTVRRGVPITPADVARSKAYWASVDDPELHAALGVTRNGQH